MNASNEKTFDVIIAGGGCSGLLTAARLADAHPDMKILVLEKEEVLGGRLRSNTPEATRHSYGLNAIDYKLFNFWNQSLKSDPEAPELESIIDRRHKTFGSLAGGKILQADVTEWLSDKGSRIIGGYAAKRQWPKMEEVIKQGELTTANEENSEEAEDSKKVESMGSLWKLARKAPAAVVIDHFSNAFGIPDVWGAATQAVSARGHMLASSMHCGNFERALELLVEHFGERIVVERNATIVDAIKTDDESWEIETQSEKYCTDSLIIAHPPWQALDWFKRDNWPTALLSLVSKTKPTSTVVLSTTIKAGEANIPDLIMVPSEKTQILRNTETEITIQATIDFEVSLQAPEVVKAVKALRRTARKLMKQVEGLELEGAHIALMPFAWPKSSASKDHRFYTKIMKKPINTKSLSFVGDAYGASYDGDQNIINSVVGVCEVFAN
jgi:glycine/D-amino acid oxidase-like deaminating enzyme